jgi:hypothetical protein
MAGTRPQDPALTKRVPIAGKAPNGKQFTGTFTITRFAQGDEGAVAVGTLRGALKSRRVVRRGVELPASIAAGEQAPGCCRGRRSASARS